MRRTLYILLTMLVLPGICLADSSQPALKIQTADTTVSGRPRTLNVTNGTLTDNGDGSFSLTTGGGGGGGGGGWTASGSNIYTTSSANNVGIGTTSPTSLLNIVGSGASNAMGQLQIINPSGSANTGFWFDAGTASNAFSFMDADTSVKYPSMIFRDRTDTVNSLGQIALGRTGSNFMTGMGRNDFGIANLSNGKSLFFGTNGGAGATAQMVILSNGNVGIGTTSPSGKLNVEGTSGNLLNLTNNGVTKFFVDNAGRVSGLTVAGVSGSFNNLSTYDGGSTNLTLSSGTGNIVMNGNVGIGTTNPNQALFVTGNILATGQMLASSGSIAFGVNGSYTGVYGAPGLSLLYFNGSAVTPALTYTNSGNVGIGTTGPLALLDVKGQSASVPAMRIQSGTLQTTPTAGAIEYDGTDFYISE